MKLLNTILFMAILQPANAQDDELTPAQALELLEDARRKMGGAEELLNEGGNLPEAEKREKDAADKLGELIKKARATGAGNQQENRKHENRTPGKSDRSNDGARQKDDPKRVEEPSKFKSTGDSKAWGNLPPAVQEALLDASREDVPPEFKELWKRYYESLQKAR